MTRKVLRLLSLGHVGQEGEGLHYLAQAHLIRQDPVDALVIQGAQPVHPLQLIRLQNSLQLQLNELLNDDTKNKAAIIFILVGSSLQTTTYKE